LKTQPYRFSLASIIAKEKLYLEAPTVLLKCVGRLPSVKLSDKLKIIITPFMSAYLKELLFR